MIQDAIAWGRKHTIQRTFIHGWGLPLLAGAYMYDRLERSFYGCSSSTCTHTDHDPGAYTYCVTAQHGYFLELLYRQTGSSLLRFHKDDQVTHTFIYAHLLEGEGEPCAYVETRSRRRFHLLARILTQQEVVDALLRSRLGEEEVVLHEYSFLHPW